MIEEKFVINSKKGLSGCLMKFSRLTLFTGVEVNLLGYYISDFIDQSSLDVVEKPIGTCEFQRYREGILELACNRDNPPIIVFKYPEAFKHESVIADFVDKLASDINKYPNLQFVVVTHSSTVFDGVRRNIKTGVLNCDEVAVNNLETVYNEQKFIRQIKIDKNGMCDMWPDKFFDQMGKDLDVLLDI